MRFDRTGKISLHSESADGSKLLLKMVSYSLFVHPRGFWIPNSLPFLKLGTTEFDPSFAARGMHPLSLALLESSFGDLNEIDRVRQTNAKKLTDLIRNNRDFHCSEPGPGTQPTFVRLPVVARDQVTRDRAIARLRDAGIGATSFYPSAICDIPDIERHMSVREFHRPAAEGLSRRLLTLPVHPFVEPQDIDRIAGVLNSL